MLCSLWLSWILAQIFTKSLHVLFYILNKTTTSAPMRRRENQIIPRGPHNRTHLSAFAHFLALPTVLPGYAHGPSGFVYRPSWLCPQALMALPTHLPGFVHGSPWLCPHTFLALSMDPHGFAHTPSWICPWTPMALPTHLPGFVHGPPWLCPHTFLALSMDPHGFAHTPSWLCPWTPMALPTCLPGFAHGPSWLCPQTFLALPTHLSGFSHTTSWHCHSHRFLLVWVWPILASVCLICLDLAVWPYLPKWVRLILFAIWDVSITVENTQFSLKWCKNYPNCFTGLVIYIYIYMYIYIYIQQFEIATTTASHSEKLAK